MIFQAGHSSLVRLSDCLKMGVGNSLETTKATISLHRKHAAALKEIREIARRHLDNEVVGDNALEEIQAASARIPAGEAQSAISLQYRLHSEALAVILTSCFALESYINSLGFFLLPERDNIGFDRMSTITKWQTIGSLKSESGFDAATSPFQDLKILFTFRNDHVHDKVVDWGSERAKKRYNNKLPDPFDGFLALSHAVFACDTYWGMILKAHELVGVPASDFHRQYNLKPWFDADFERQVRQTAADYDQVTGSPRRST